jgi:HK97 family phage major capsid protein
MPQPPMFARPITAQPAAISLAKFAKVLFHGKSRLDQIELAERLREMPQVAAAFAFHTKAPVAATSLADAPWASALGTSGITGEVFRLLMDLTAFDGLSTVMPRVSFRVPIARELETGAVGGWIAEGAGAPVVAFSWDALRLTPAKAGCIVVMTKESLRMSVSTDITVRDSLLRTLGLMTDSLFLDPGVTGSITAAVGVHVASTGVSAAQVTADLGTMLDGITTPGRGLTWLMGRKTSAKLAAVLGAAGASLPTRLYGLPVIASASMPTDSGSPAGSLIVLVDAASVAFAADEYSVELSDQATLQMDTAPTMKGAPTVTATAGVSLFQNDLVAYLQQRSMNWSARAGSVAYLTPGL